MCTIYILSLCMYLNIIFAINPPPPESSNHSSALQFFAASQKQASEQKHDSGEVKGERSAAVCVLLGGSLFADNVLFWGRRLPLIGWDLLSLSWFAESCSRTWNLTFGALIMTVIKVLEGFCWNMKTSETFLWSWSSTFRRNKRT